MLRYTTRPLSDRIWLRKPSARVMSQFTSTWSDTQDLLASEIGYLAGKNIIIEVDVPSTAIRIDGQLYARTRAETPAIVVAFESKYGPLLYRSDQYGSSGYGSRMEIWQHNVRAVALTLQALRAVDRYGASRSGEQYRGYKALEDKSAQPPMSIDEAVELLAGMSNRPVEEVREDIDAIHAAFRTAARNAHPDHGGDPAQMARLSQAYDIAKKGMQ